ncbi:10275_t:CDS:2 [Cetraspora pellucida]|uniref:10275_t:CDS:1 n=1 Tax=Cetraspora pellucida TaxID=1433469 RepID=A0ACA9L2Q9_9GLOM|nr:10275_t:CDS:2 [Cetraspora pellucida]
MPRKRQFSSKVLYVGTIESHLHYGVWARAWWETSIKIKTEMKDLVIPYRLYMRIACELNGKTFIVTVVPNNKNSLKPGFQCTCDAIGTDNIESSPSAAINMCYQSTFKTKTEYSGLSVMGFEDENIIQQLINDVVFFPIFVCIEKLAVRVYAIRQYQLYKLLMKPPSLDFNVEEEYDEDDMNLDQNNERENAINNNPIVLITIPSEIDVGFPLTKGWVLKGSQKLGNRGGTRIKKDIRAMLERFFLYGDQRPEEKMSAKAMREELLEYAEGGEIEKEDIPKIQTIQN